MKIDNGRRAERGAIFIETAMMLSVILLLLLGGVTTAIVAYQQVTADAGSFFGARAYALALSNPTTLGYESNANLSVARSLANSAVASVLPKVDATRLGYAAVAMQPAGLGAVAAQPAYTDQSARHGGVTLVTPQGRQASFDQFVPGIFGTGGQAHITGVAMEPDMQIVNREFNMSGDAAYAVGGATAKYFGTAMDAPPYFFGHQFAGYCDVMVWSGVCTPGHWEFRAFGSAEHLDRDNWSGGRVSIQKSGSGTPNVFEAMLCHQRVYAHIAQTLFASQSRPVYTPGAGGVANLRYDETTPLLAGGWQNYPLSLVASWDATISNGFSIGQSSVVGTTPVHPLAGCSNV